MLQCQKESYCYYIKEIVNKFWKIRRMRLKFPGQMLQLNFKVVVVKYTWPPESGENSTGLLKNYDKLIKKKIFFLAGIRLNSRTWQLSDLLPASHPFCSECQFEIIFYFGQVVRITFSTIQYCIPYCTVNSIVSQIPPRIAINIKKN